MGRERTKVKVGNGDEEEARGVERRVGLVGGGGGRIYAEAADFHPWLLTAVAPG